MTVAPGSTLAYVAAVTAWARHLRAGGAERWSEFWPAAGQPPASDVIATSVGDLPGAAQLELTRRVAERHPGRDISRLADRIARRDAPGRGMGRAPVAHPAAPAVFGTPPVDPGSLPDHELIRLGVGVLCDFSVERPVRGLPKSPGPRGRHRPVALGAPYSRFALETPALTSRDVVVCAPTLDELLGEVWAVRTSLGAAGRWGRFVSAWAGRDALPPSADVEQLAATAARRVGADHVHVFVGAAARPLVGPPDLLSPESVDVLRRLNRLLDLRVDERRRPLARAAAASWLRGPGRPLGVPPEWQGWVRQRSERLAEAVSRAGYAVHGDLTELVAGVQGPRAPRTPLVLDRLVDALVAADASSGGRVPGSRHSRRWRSSR